MDDKRKVTVDMTGGEWPPYHLVMDGHLQIDWKPLTPTGEAYLRERAAILRAEREDDELQSKHPGQ